MKREYAIDKLIEYHDKCVNMYDLCKKMGIEKIGGEDYKEVRSLANDLNIELIFSYKRNFFSKKRKKMETEKILVENSTYKDATALKQRLFKEGLKEYRCEKCGISEWMGENISLQIHHINGIHNDNRIENIQILCPNCHSQTETYSGKNANKEKTTTFLKKEKQYKNKSYKKNSKEIETIGAKLSFEDTHPSFNELIEDFKNLKSFVNVGKKYGVSDNGVRRWCEHYNIPKTKKKLFEFINKELS